MTFQKPKGTEDFFPEDMSIRQQVVGRLRATAERYGYGEVSSPAFESLQLLTEKEGEEIRGQIFTLEKRSNEEFGLRFDLTVPMARMVIERIRAMPKPIRWFMIDRMWRYEKPQAGRLREFYQLSVELYGAEGADADAELIKLVIACLESFGLTSRDIKVRINNRKLLEGLLREKVGKDDVLDLIPVIDKFSKLSREDFKAELSRFTEDSDAIIEILETEDISKIMTKNQLAKEGLSDLQSIFRQLPAGYAVFSPSTARGLAYYTGTVFEVFDTKGKYRAIAGGGRYDNMIALFKGPATPASGFGLGITTLTLLLKDLGLLPKPNVSPDYFVAVANSECREKAMLIVEKMRRRWSVVVDISNRNLKNQVSYAGSIGARKLIVIGDQEIASGVLKVKDMQTGAETELQIESMSKT